MKKVFLLMTTVILLVLLLTGCSAPATIKDALEEVGIEPPEEIYSTDNFNDIEVAFYKNTESGKITIGLFNKENNSIHFITSQDLEESQLDSNVGVTLGAYVQSNTKKLPKFTFQVGVINDPQIISVNLQMTGSEFEDRYASVIEIDGVRVWYTFLDAHRIFNVLQGISEDGTVVLQGISENGTVIYSNSK